MRLHPRATRPSLLSLGLGLLAVGYQPSSHPAVQRSSLAGLWKFNVDQSDSDLGDKVQQAFRPGAHRGGFGGEGGRGGRPVPGSTGREPDGTNMMSSLRPVLQLLIEQDDSSVTISDAAGQMLTYRTDGRKLKEILLNGNETDITAGWKEGRLIIERKFKHSGAVKETYERDPASGKLIVLVKLSGGPMPRTLEVRRVYDPAAGG
jgi:hypothetical protein